MSTTLEILLQKQRSDPGPKVNATLGLSSIACGGVPAQSWQLSLEAKGDTLPALLWGRESL